MDFEDGADEGCRYGLSFVPVLRRWISVWGDKICMRPRWEEIVLIAMITTRELRYKTRKKSIYRLCRRPPTFETASPNLQVGHPPRTTWRTGLGRRCPPLP
jgi:hypothetical protein